MHDTACGRLPTAPAFALGAHELDLMLSDEAIAVPSLGGFEKGSFARSGSLGLCRTLEELLGGWKLEVQGSTVL